MSTLLRKGQVFWITGVPGAGKTTIARQLCLLLEGEQRRPVSLDGDTLREVLGAGPGDYSPERRRELAFVYGRLCRMLSAQGFDVVCATVSMFKQVQDWNRDNIENYFEILVRAPMDALRKRDQKGLYSAAENVQAPGVVGIDIAAEEPEAPELIIENDGSRSPHEIVEVIRRSPAFKRSSGNMKDV